MASSRPRPNAACAGVDSYKYGLTDALPRYAGGITDRKVMMDSLAKKRVHVFLGSNDNGPGDTSCQAGTQGRTHLERGNYYVRHITKQAGGTLPSRWTVKYAPCTHDAECMYTSDQGVKTIMLDGLPSRKRSVRRATGGAKHAELARSSNDDDDEE